MKKHNTFDKAFWRYISIFVLVVTGVLFLPSLITSKCWFGFDFSDTGQIGDTIGGIISPFIAIAAAALTFFAFWVQFKANEQQRNDIALERFENKFYELLRIHRQNVEEMKIGTLEKREVFKELYYELSNCIIFVNNVFDVLKRDNQSQSYMNFDSEKKINIAYQMFFYGNEFNNIFNILDSYKEIPKSEVHLIFNKINSVIKENNSHWEVGGFSLKENKKTNIPPFPLVSYYKPYLGQGQLLGHYFRHLYQTVNFIDKDSVNNLSSEDKYKYVKILRAQLSDYEQLLFYYNALSDLGSPWFVNGKESLIIKYRLIKNLPLPLAFGYFPKLKLSQFIPDNEIEQFFEWDERVKEK
jgi:hypothetical protein